MKLQNEADDTERLDFMIENQAIISSQQGNNGVLSYNIYQRHEIGGGFKQTSYSTPREAIDGARAEIAARGRQ